MRSMRWTLTGAVLVLASCGGGSSSTETDALCASTDAGLEVVYKVGDTGPGCGIIVYVDESGFDSFSVGKLFEPSIFALCPTGTCHYLEMAPTDVGGELSWSDAVNAAENYSTATAADWVLPSIDALVEMCKYALGGKAYNCANYSGNGPFSNRVGGFSTDNVYWSSSEYNNLVAWWQDFGYGWINVRDKVGSAYVRPVRAF